MFDRCLICTDLADGLDRLGQFVPSLAAAGMKQIVFMHNVPLWEEGEIPRIDREKIDRSRDRLGIATLNVPSGVEVKIEIRSGRTVDNIIQVAKTYHTDLIILGSPTRSLLNEKLFGSVAIALSKAIAIPLMLLRPQLIYTYTAEELNLRCQHLFRTLLIPYNDSDAAKYLVEQIKQHVQSCSANCLEKCKLCWVVDDGGRREISKDYQLNQAQERLKAIKADLELSFQVEIDVRLGEPITEILEATRSFDSSAIAISSDTLGKMLEWSHPSFAGEIIRRSWHPVLFFPPHK